LRTANNIAQMQETTAILNQPRWIGEALGAPRLPAGIDGCAGQ
jgi:hypothetical protein